MADLSVPVHPDSPGLRYVTVRTGARSDTEAGSVPEPAESCLVDLCFNDAAGQGLAEQVAERLLQAPDVAGVLWSVNPS
ncbi:MAG: hypothetical protein KC561_21915, partial [Myxococcales bacterium]|nr:hypothetical protein [Myxococcales bacterium]